MSKPKSKAKSKHQKQQQKINPWFIIGGAALLVVLAVAVFSLMGGGNTAAQPAAVAQNLPDEITVAEAATMRDAGAFVLDVRTQEEWNDHHIPGTTLIPLDQLESRVNEVPRDQEVVVVCRSGNRSATGRDILRQAGFEQVTSMAGGLNAWRGSGLPTVSGP